MHAEVRIPTDDQRVTLRLGWQDFERFLLMRGEAVRPRIAYLDGVLELMSPSKSHEGIKKRLARLVEYWAITEGITLGAFGSTTLKKKRGKAGAEPDECYVVNRSEMTDVPDIAIEVNWSASGLDKLELYHRLGVPEVWVWENDSLGIYRRRARGYVKRSRSGFLPTLDVKWLEPFVREPDQGRAISAFVAELRRN
ncbi:MAG: Uma2 family endonuclease [Myxococcaceae bacterium]|nr:Uma2 family endonuclease [Myxococcaceae bacterium]